MNTTWWFVMLVLRVLVIYFAVLGLVVAVCLTSVLAFRWARARRHDYLVQAELEQLIDEETSR